MVCRLLLVDDSAEFLESAEYFLRRQNNVQVVGRALDGNVALDEVTRLAPDLVLMDIAMPGLSGLEVTRRLKARPFPPVVVLLTLYDTPEYRAAAVAVGADGFVSKADFCSGVLGVLGTMDQYRPAEASSADCGR
jgi:two-component system invasion response regulator UvrY